MIATSLPRGVSPGTIPRYMVYRERLSPGSAPVEVELPQSRDDAFMWLDEINRLATSDPVAWKSQVRKATACDWYMLYFFLTPSRRLDPFTGRPEFDCDFQFNYAREKQFDGDGVADNTAREHGKSTWDIFVGCTNYIIVNPNESMAIFAFEKAAAARHGLRLKVEWESNFELRTAWDDVFYWNPEKQSPLWHQDNGLMVKSPLNSVALRWFSIMQLPTGLRISRGFFDDIETEDTTSTEEMRAKTVRQVNSAYNLAGRGCRWRVDYTHHHPAGWGASVIASRGYRRRCHAAEDITRPAPDIAALYDASGGFLPVREESGTPIPLPAQVRSIKLDGDPVYLHPLECALKRFLMGDQKYNEQNMGDPTSGQSRRLMGSWIRRYKMDPIEWATGANIYITLDASKGESDKADPSFARVYALKSDRRISWVGGFRRILSPSQLEVAMFTLCMEWGKIGRLIQLRVEEFGQSTWGHNLRTHFTSRNRYIAPIVSCGSHNKNNRLREYAALEPAYRLGTMLWPDEATGLISFDEHGNPVDLCDYYFRNEFEPFPQPITDDGLASEYLLFVPKGRIDGAPKEVELTLEYPESDEEADLRDRSSGRYSRRRQEEESTDHTWMSEGL